jgi:hypothetical protein
MSSNNKTNKPLSKISYYEAICYANKKTSSSLEPKKIIRYFYTKDGARDYVKYGCEGNKKYKIFEIEVIKHIVKGGLDYKKQVYKKIIK